ncbi:hypothetical protein QR510_30115, partial [Escherichia coli]|uniref:hypothetical protein n=1 Tax=Escherichia coli TaxID=562 RepID=UPI002738958E
LRQRSRLAAYSADHAIGRRSCERFDLSQELLVQRRVHCHKACRRSPNDDAPRSVSENDILRSTAE